VDLKRSFSDPLDLREVFLHFLREFISTLKFCCWGGDGHGWVEILWRIIDFARLLPWIFAKTGKLFVWII